MLSRRSCLDESAADCFQHYITPLKIQVQEERETVVQAGSRTHALAGKRKALVTECRQGCVQLKRRSPLQENQSVGWAK